MAIKKARDAAKKGGVPTKDGSPSSVSQVFRCLFSHVMQMDEPSIERTCRFGPVFFWEDNS